jgi:hypothetical protein
MPGSASPPPAAASALPRATTACRAIGVNVNLSANVCGLAEINYADYGRFAGINLQRRHVAAGIGFRF